MPEIHDQDVIAVSPDAISTDLHNEAVILNQRSGIYYGLTEVGAFAWKRMQKPATLESLVEAILGEFDVGRERCRADLVALLDSMKDAGLVTIQSVHPTSSERQRP